MSPNPHTTKATIDAIATWAWTLRPADIEAVLGALQTTWLATAGAEPGDSHYRLVVAFQHFHEEITQLMPEGSPP